MPTPSPVPPKNKPECTKNHRLHAIKPVRRCLSNSWLCFNRFMKVKMKLKADVHDQHKLLAALWPVLDRPSEKDEAFFSSKLSFTSTEPV